MPPTWSRRPTYDPLHSSIRHRGRRRWRGADPHHLRDRGAVWRRGFGVHRAARPRGGRRAAHRRPSAPPAAGSRPDAGDRHGDRSRGDARGDAVQRQDRQDARRGRPPRAAADGRLRFGQHRHRTDRRGAGRPYHGREGRQLVGTQRRVPTGVRGRQDHPDRRIARCCRPRRTRNTQPVRGGHHHVRPDPRGRGGRRSRGARPGPDLRPGQEVHDAVSVGVHRRRP